MSKRILTILLAGIFALVLVAEPVLAQRHQRMHGQRTYESMRDEPWVGDCLMGYGMMIPGMMMSPGMMHYGYGSRQDMMYRGDRGYRDMPEYDEKTLERMREFQRNMPGFTDETRSKMRELQRAQSQLMLALTEDEVDIDKARELYKNNLKLWNDLALMRFDHAIEYLQQNQ